MIWPEKYGILEQMYTRMEKMSSFQLFSYILTRNDESIRFAESKVTVIFGIIALTAGIILNYLTEVISYILKNGDTFVWLLVAIAIFSFLLSLVFSFLVLYPKLSITNECCLLYFGDTDKYNENEFKDKIINRKKKEVRDEFIWQVHATAKIATRKFTIIKYLLITTAVYLFSITVAYIYLVIKVEYL